MTSLIPKEIILHGFFYQVIIRIFIAKRSTNLNHGISGVISHIQIKTAGPDRFLQSIFCNCLRNCTSLAQSKSRHNIDN